MSSHARARPHRHHPYRLDEELYADQVTDTKRWARRDPPPPARPLPASRLGLRGGTRPEHSRLSLSATPSAPPPPRTAPRLSVNEAQVKYALLSRAAYERDADKRDRLLAGNALTSGFVLDTELSGPKNQVYRDAGTGEIVISYKGTNPASGEDIYDDLAILNPNVREQDTSRFRRAEALYRQVVAKYGSDARVACTGHSLGGSIAMHVAKEHDLMAYVYNPGASANVALAGRGLGDSGNKTVVYRTSGDLVSVLAPYVKGDGVQVVDVPGKKGVTGLIWLDELNAHGLDNFTTTHKSDLRAAEDTVFAKFDHEAAYLWDVTKRAVFKTAYDDMVPEELNKAGGYLEKGWDKFKGLFVSHERQQTDALMDMAASDKSTTVGAEVDLAGDIVSSHGVRYVEAYNDSSVTATNQKRS